jgi:hypothetical protein
MTPAQSPCEWIVQLRTPSDPHIEQQVGQTGPAGVCEISHCINYLEQISKRLVRIHSLFIKDQGTHRDYYLLYLIPCFERKEREGERDREGT